MPKYEPPGQEIFEKMCDHDHVTCDYGGIKYIGFVAWCSTYASTHKVCPKNIIAIRKVPCNGMSIKALPAHYLITNASANESPPINVLLPLKTHQATDLWSATSLPWQNVVQCRHALK
jgi:hypothetical protein